MPYGPPGVVINERLEVLHFRRSHGPLHLEPLPGAASLNILCASRGLKLRTDEEALPSCRRARADARVIIEELPLFTLARAGAASGSKVVPITDPESQSRCLLVLFHEPRARSRADAAAGRENQARRTSGNRFASSNKSCSSTKSTC